ncbi:trypsin-like peptidase domain-containing protein [Phytohabitans sp. ZYX-F-186]|uniref:Trypsin-like peptidase domain-containing protein n=1 Tax=Phytohabitans maris TaxID=3071409 RepID=A0ABU0ZJG4_9ACTN|nr:trypsin-like peptidase domain-containing protein [Phytohabitans sp. ZYX-F-186]MDQ7907189.1 trypsin-like peptidase domain-containing protein [Phytohabitans sp. ZYX-F-186]
MSEHETNPQRQPVSPDAEPSHPTSELPPAAREQSGSSDETQQVPVVSEQPTPPAPAPSAAPDTPAPDATAPIPATPPAPPAFTAPAATPAGPAPGHYAPPPSPWQHPDRAHQPTWPGNAGYPSAGVPPVTAPPAGAPGPVSPGPAAHGPVPPGAVPPPASGVPHYGPLPPGQVPVWAQPPGAPPGQHQRSGRFGRYAMLGVAALVLMAGSGVAGGAIATALDDSPATVNRTYSAAPVLNQADLPGIAAKVAGSVVSITAGNAGGSGVVLSEDGYVLTNNHVVESVGSGTIGLTFADGKTASAKVVGTDPRTDLAVIKADGVSGLTAAAFGDSDGMQVGDTVLALGSPLGLDGSVTSGIISAKDRTIQTGDDQQRDPFSRQQQAPVSSISGLLQTDAAINPGNSGGALINTRGEVIGINTAILTAGQSSGNIGVGFAIPSNKAKSVADALRNGEKVSHPSLGVSVNDADGGGALIGSVTEGSPAAKAGLQQGDVVTKFGDKNISDSDDLVGAVQAGKVGDQVQITFKRNGQEQTATVTLAEAS